MCKLEIFSGVNPEVVKKVGVSIQLGECINTLGVCLVVFFTFLVSPTPPFQCHDAQLSVS